MNLSINETTKIKCHETVYSNIYNETDPIRISKEVIEGLEKFICKNLDYNYSLKREIEYAASWPITSAKCDVAINIILANDPVINVVEDMVNYHEESKLCKFFWERFFTIENQSMISAWNEKQIKILKVDGVYGFPMITITKKAFNALKQAKMICGESSNISSRTSLTTEEDLNFFKNVREEKKAQDQKQKRLEEMCQKSLLEEQRNLDIQKFQKLLKANFSNFDSALKLSGTSKTDYIRWFRNNFDPDFSFDAGPADSQKLIFLLCIDTPNNLNDQEYDTIWKERSHLSLYKDQSIKERLQEMEKVDSRNSCNCCTLF